jgi:hypothetical protein
MGGHIVGRFPSLGISEISEKTREIRRHRGGESISKVKVDKDGKRKKRMTSLLDLKKSMKSYLHLPKSVFSNLPIPSRSAVLSENGHRAGKGTGWLRQILMLIWFPVQISQPKPTRSGLVR